MSPTTVASGPSGPARRRDSRPTRITALSDSAASGLPPGVAALRARPWDCSDVMTLLLTGPRHTDGLLNRMVPFQTMCRAPVLELLLFRRDGGATFLVSIGSGLDASLTRIVCSERVSDHGRVRLGISRK